MQGNAFSWRKIAVCFALLAWSDATAHAQVSSAQPRDVDEAQARAHFNTGSVAFSAGNFADALVEFRKAYEFSQRPQLLYNIAVSSDRLRQDADAVHAFEEYLRLVPDAPQRAEVTGRIAALRTAMQASVASATAAPVAPVVTESAPASEPVTDVVLAPAADVAAKESNLGPWVALGASAVVAVTGGVLLTIAAIDQSSVTNADPGVRLNEIEGAHERVPTFSLLGGVLLGVGVLGAGASVAWMMLSDDDDAAPVLVGVGLGALSVRGNW